MSDNNNNNDPNELNDDAFDVEEEFEDVNFDEEAFDEADFSDDVDGDVEYTDEELAGEEWQDDDAAAMAADPKNKKLYRGGKEKKPGLSFNAMVIIGAVVVGGGVMVFTVMNKSQEVASAKNNIFRSMLNISDVMDGRLFGDKPKEEAATDTPVTDAPVADGGFLNNPEELKTAETPPQPSPIAPAENAAPNEPLTPMPEDGQQVPRVPEATPPTDTAVIVPAEETPVVVMSEETNKAEAMLKEAMANREATPTEIPATPNDVAATPAIPVAPEVIAQPAPATPAEIKAAVPVETAASVPAVPVVDEQTKESVKALQAKLDEVLSRMNGIEGEINSLKQSGNNSGGADLKQIEQSVQSLKQDLNEIKSRPAQVVEKTIVEKVVQAEPANDGVEEPKPAPVKKKKALAKKTSTEPAYKAPSATSGKWELRAAQPGKAWVSKPGERDMRGVQIGETLPGIGQITGIVYQNGRWTVQGTQGQILQ